MTGRARGDPRVAVDGRSGAGKTLLAAELREQLGAPVVALEDLYGGWDGLEDGIGLLVADVLVPLRAGRAALVPRYDWVAAAWAEPWPLEPPAVLIIEGVGAGARRAAADATVLVWVEVAAPVSASSGHWPGTAATFAPVLGHLGRAGGSAAGPRAHPGAGRPSRRGPCTAAAHPAVADWVTRPPGLSTRGRLR